MPPLPVRLDWLDLQIEPIIEPELEIIDPHHHFYLKPNLSYLLDDLAADLASGHKILATVYLECRSKYRTEGDPDLACLGETEFVVGLAREAERRGIPSRIAAGIIGRVDMMLGARVERVLEAQIAAGEGRFRGIRYSTVWHADPDAQGSPIHSDPGVMTTKVFREAFARLAPLGLSYEAWLYHTQIGELIDLARAFPETPIVLDHIGGVLAIGPYAGKRDEVFAGWKKDIAALAGCPNVSVKLGGGGMRMFGFGWHDGQKPPTSEEIAKEWRPYVETCIEAFGTQRAMYESNFPVDKCSYSYPVIWNAFKRIAAGSSAGEKADLFPRNGAADLPALKGPFGYEACFRPDRRGGENARCAIIRAADEAAPDTPLKLLAPHRSSLRALRSPRLSDRSAAVAPALPGARRCTCRL
ncbi:MAG: amidohydrolase family protein [Pirellulales bacterium]